MRWCLWDTGLGIGKPEVERRGASRMGPGVEAGVEAEVVDATDAF